MSGQNIVVHSESEHCGISQKIVDENIRKKLYKYVRSQINDSFGFVIRTSAVDALKYDLKEECFQLANELTGIITSSKFSVIKSCLYAPHPLLKALYTYRFNEISTIISDDAEIIHTLNLSDQFKNIPLKSYTDSYSLENLYKINTQIQTALSRNVWLKSGANVIFDTCEAATVIDINSKKSEFKLTHNDASLKINLEAAKLIGLQIQLRNISGIILIDFIDVDPMDHQSIIDTLSEALKSDPYKTTIYGFTQLGLLECSRQKKDLPLFQLLKTVEEFK